MPRSFAFPRQSRLKQSGDFFRLKTHGQRVVCGCLIANWLELPSASPARLGVVTSGKIGGAVVRSRARRLLREAYRLHQHELEKPVELILIARNSIVGKVRSDVERDLLAALRRARLLKEPA